ncbi:MAG: DUF4382 domain-containing protein [Candidatus Acidiferrales bacterium]
MRKLDSPGYSYIFLPLLFVGLLAVALLAACGGGGGSSSSNLTGTINTSMSDPSTCEGALAPTDLQLEQVWVTVVKVRAHISSGADPDAGGWEDLVDLTSNPKQIDLLSGTDTTCILTTLGRTEALPAGRYQQIRLILLSNNPGGGAATPSPNNCGDAGPGPGPFNCVKPVGEVLQELELSSEAQTGIKIPPGQLAGGGLNLEAGEDADINIDFDACASIVRQGNGDFRLKPVLHAGEVSITQDILSGRAVSSVGLTPLTDSTIVVLLEQPDAEGIDRVVLQKTADPATGTFRFCPVPPGTYDVVIAAIDGNGVTYNATIIFNVTGVTNLGDIPLVPEPGPDTSPGTITGQVTTQDTGGVATGSDIALSALQSATPTGGSARLVTIPTFGASTPNVVTAPDAACPANTDCITYTLIVPASNPNVGTFSAGSVTYTSPAGPPVAYSVNGRAFVPGSGGTANCTPPSVTVNKLSDGTTDLTVSAGTTATAQTIAFTGCQPGL